MKLIRYGELPPGFYFMQFPDGIVWQKTDTGDIARFVPRSQDGPVVGQRTAPCEVDNLVIPVELIRANDLPGQR